MRNRYCAIILFPIVYVLLSFFVEFLYGFENSRLKVINIYIKDFHIVSHISLEESKCVQNHKRIEVSLENQLQIIK